MMSHPAPFVLRVGGCSVVIDEADRSLVTFFPDGSALPARGNANPESIARSHEIGYAGDTWAMSRDHEIAHSFLAHKAGKPYCDVLYRAAHGCPAAMPPGREERERVEAMVLTFQRFARTGEGRWDAVYFLNGLGDIDDLAAEFRALVGG
jgi:hypothetical protein